MNTKYLSFILVGPLQIKSYEELDIVFFSDKASFELKSESNVIESDYSPVSQIGVTKFDVDDNPAFISFLKENTINKVVLEAKNGTMIKTKVKIDFDEIDQALLLKTLV